jgi:hypothetical protein
MPWIGVDSKPLYRYRAEAVRAAEAFADRIRRLGVDRAEALRLAGAAPGRPGR